MYCHISPSNKKYVGISCNAEKRWNSGRGYSKNYRFWRAIKKYGWENFEHIILAENLTESEAKEMEVDLINKWKLTDFNYGYNLREGGDGSLSEYSRKLLSASRTGKPHPRTPPRYETKEKISKSLTTYYSTHPNPMKGKHHKESTILALKNRKISDETKEKMKNNHADFSGKNNPSSRAIRQLTRDGNLVAEYDYAKLAAIKYGLDLSSIIKCCRGKLKTCGGYRWEYI